MLFRSIGKWVRKNFILILGVGILAISATATFWEAAFVRPKAEKISNLQNRLFEHNQDSQREQSRLKTLLADKEKLVSTLNKELLSMKNQKLSVEANSSASESTNNITTENEAPPNTITRCDELASHPFDANNPEGVLGVAWDDIDVNAALEACKKDYQNNSSNARTQFLYGRSNDKNGDHETAVSWYRLAAEQGYVSAQTSLGLMYQGGLGVEQNYETAVGWYTLAANQQDAVAQNNLGLVYQNGYGVEENLESAVDWYQLAADQGYVSAQTSLGIMYANGWGIEQNYNTAIYWYQLAADQQDAIAQNNLGVIYQNGHGVEKNLKTAAEWYQLAVNQGYTPAIANLESLKIVSVNHRNIIL